jgi:kumamolisin
MIGNLKQKAVVQKRKPVAQKPKPKAVVQKRKPVAQKPQVDIQVESNLEQNKYVKLVPKIKILPDDNTEDGIKNRALRPNYTSSTLKNYYNFPSQNNPSSRPKIAIISFGGTYLTSDLNAYWNFLGLTTKPTVNYVQVAGATNKPDQPIQPGDGTDENTLDIQIVGATCPNSIITVYFAPNSLSVFPTVLEAALLNNDIVSISWGAPEVYFGSTLATNINNILKKYPTKIVTVASGDNGCSDGISTSKPYADFPSSLPFVLACGGTSLTNPSLESTWSWNTTYQWGAGGGCSALFVEPTYQAKVPDFSYSTTNTTLKTIQTNLNKYRKTPDISFNADPLSGWQVLVNGVYITVGGTSCVSPFVAGFFGLCNLKLKQNINNILYDIYYNKTKLPFKDITSGSINNINVPYYYNARTNYDVCSGLGSFNGILLYQQLLAYV